MPKYSYHEHEGLFSVMYGKLGETFYFIFRILLGFLFFAHGAQKLFGWYGGQANTLTSLMGVAGIIEFVGGLALLLGFWTRLAALGSALLMVIAYVMVHAPDGFIPLVNKGELAVLYFIAFLIVLHHGAGRASLEKALFKKELF